jgi:hypothetical protein
MAVAGYGIYVIVDAAGHYYHARCASGKFVETLLNREGKHGQWIGFGNGM